MLIKNTYVYHSVGIKELKHVLITDEGEQIAFPIDTDITQIQETDIIDARGEYFLMPGMLDSHVHGQGGIDFADLDDEVEEEQLEHIVKALGATGLSYALATLVSMPIASLKKALVKINGFVQKQEQNPTPGCTQILGVHLEGPFISKQCKGAHAEEVLQESISMSLFREIIDVAPNITHWKITLAPDLPGAEEFIKQSKTLEQQGIFVKVFLGHCNPENRDAIERAIDAGACGFTHLGNACQESCSRDPRELSVHDVKSNLVQWVLNNPERCPPGVELITDGVHLSNSFISLIHSTIQNKIILVTDALGPAGCKNGLYKLGSLDICQEQASFYLTNGTGDFLMKEGILPTGEKGLVKILAGSAASLSLCVQKYFAAIPQATLEQKMDFLYTALITNPRMASLSKRAIENLSDRTNFSLFNNKGQLILSSCHGQVIEHLQFRSTAGLHQFGFLASVLTGESKDDGKNNAYRLK
ncbi:N-acetylglucosamine-6-phosphate deacetylase [Legionella saoudiensis]|uniref:N-acetylglucosamine-6-phosphate deacetylase n=1 Tax=Legionella saoudiensis TaxID=1750561 RepID=UPI000730F5FC|nr:N-acetylglucosamine-6-phosphate deacetylase [Legionella saoudiensis]